MNQSKQKAEHAINFSKKVVSEGGDFHLAMIYVLNALSHDSSDVTNLLYYAELLRKKPDLSISEIDQFTDILDRYVFNVDAKKVEDVIAIRKVFEEKRSALVAASNATVKNENNSFITKSLAELETGRLSISNILVRGGIDGDLLKKRIDLQNRLLSEASLVPEREVEVSKSLRDSVELQTNWKVISDAQNAFAKAEKWTKKKSFLR